MEAVSTRCEHLLGAGSTKVAGMAGHGATAVGIGPAWASARTDTRAATGDQGLRRRAADVRAANGEFRARTAIRDASQIRVPATPIARARRPNAIGTARTQPVGSDTVKPAVGGCDLGAGRTEGCSLFVAMSKVTGECLRRDLNPERFPVSGDMANLHQALR